MAEMNVPGVEYRDVAGFPGYKVGSDGSVWSRNWHHGTWRRLAGGPIKGGYITVVLSRGKIRRTRMIHHLVLEAFIGPRPQGKEACHDPDPSPNNNNLSNLRWDTRQANSDDKVRLGRQAKGEGNGFSELTESVVLEMRQLAESGLSNTEIASRFGCNYRTVSVVVTGESWKHVAGPTRAKMTGGARPRICIDGKTVKEVARQHGVTVQAIHYRMKRGLPLEFANLEKHKRPELRSPRIEQVQAK